MFSIVSRGQISNFYRALPITCSISTLTFSFFDQNVSVNEQFGSTNILRGVKFIWDHHNRIMRSTSASRPLIIPILAPLVSQDTENIIILYT